MTFEEFIGSISRIIFADPYRQMIWMVGLVAVATVWFAFQWRTHARIRRRVEAAITAYADMDLAQ